MRAGVASRMRMRKESTVSVGRSDPGSAVNGGRELKREEGSSCAAVVVRI